MNIKIEPGRLVGNVTPPPSKSLLHRYILSSALATGESVIENADASEDVLATLRCVSALGAKWRLEGGALYVSGMGGVYKGEPEPRFDCGESGTTLRLMLPVASVLCGGGIFTGGKRLMERPLQPYFNLFDSAGIDYSLSGEKMRIKGTLAAGEYFVPGNISSQFFSGLMFAMAMCRGESLIAVDGVLESAAYAEMTCEVLRLAGIDAFASGDGFHISGGSIKPRHYFAEADWSQAAFWIAANAVGGDVHLNALSEASMQGDRHIAELSNKLRQSGVKEINVAQWPDLLPPMAVIAAFSPGSCRFTGCERLRHKESDRVAAVCGVLSALGADISECDNIITVTGKRQLAGDAAVDCRNDHRIAMMASVAALGCREPVVISGCECVRKSYPSFYEHFSALGGKIHAV